MALNIAETAANSSTEIGSVFICPKNPGLIWDFTDNTIPWLLVAIASIASPAIVALNAVVIIAVKQRRELQRPSNILLSSLAAADLLVGAIALPLSAVVDFLFIHQVLLDYVCILDAVTNYVVLVSCGSSLYHLTFIAWERYVAVQKWMDYKVKVTKGRLRKLAIIAWLTPLLSTFPGIVLLAVGANPKYLILFNIGVLVTQTAPLLFLTYFYVMVYIGVRKRKLSHIAQVTALVTAKLEKKVAKTTGLITATLILFFVPAAVVAIMEKKIPILQKSWVFKLVEIVVQLNSVVNPLIYCYRDRRFRTAVLELLRLKKPQATHRPDGAVRFVRQENPVGSLIMKDVREQHNAEIRKKRLARSASCNQVVVLDFALELVMKRSMSDPSLAAKGSSFANDLQQQHQTSSVLITTSTIHAERDDRGRVGSRKPKFRSAGDGGQPQTEKSPTRLRSASFESAAVGSDCTQRRSREITMQRIMSASSLGQGNSFYDGLQQQQEPSSIVSTTSTITVKTSCQNQAGKMYPKCLKELKLGQVTAGLLIRGEPRSKSLSAGATAFNSTNRRQGIQEKIVQRPKSAPCFKANTVVPHEELMHPGFTSRQLSEKQACIEVDLNLLPFK